MSDPYCPVCCSPRLAPHLYGGRVMGCERQSDVQMRQLSRRGSVAGLVLLGLFVLGACANTDSFGVSGTGFDSPQQAAEAFGLSDLPIVEKWDERVGSCRVLLIGDSLTEAVASAQRDAFSYIGCESIVDGLAARSLSTGWQCLASGGRSLEISMRMSPEPGNASCRPSGLELLGLWSDFAHSASAVVIALGTNDAGIYSEGGWIRRWEQAASLSSGPLVFVTAAARPGDRWVDKVERFNTTLRWWCPSQPRCVLAEWDQTTPAQDPNSYTDHVHLTRAAGEMRAVFIAAVTRRFASPAPSGPRRWTAPDLDLTELSPSSVLPSPTIFPSNPTSSPNPSFPTNSTSPGQPWPPQPTTTSANVPSSSPATTTTTTTLVSSSDPPSS